MIKETAQGVSIQNMIEKIQSQHHGHGELKKTQKPHMST